MKIVLTKGVFTEWPFGPLSRRGCVIVQSTFTSNDTPPVRSSVRVHTVSGRLVARTELGAESGPRGEGDGKVSDGTFSGVDFPVPVV